MQAYESWLRALELGKILRFAAGHAGGDPRRPTARHTGNCSKMADFKQLAEAQLDRDYVMMGARTRRAR